MTALIVGGVWVVAIVVVLCMIRSARVMAAEWEAMDRRREQDWMQRAVLEQVNSYREN